MPDPAPNPNPELLRSLGRLVRGLSALFWGLPLALIICVQTAKAEWLKVLSIAPPIGATGLLAFGLWQLSGFQKQERVWRQALDRATLLSLVNLGLSPFLFFWNRVPENRFFFLMILLLGFSGLLFLASINLVLQRLGAMLPDETLRQETRQFTSLNLNLLLTTLLFGITYLGLGQLANLPTWLSAFVLVLEHGSSWIVILLVLLPLAMTMALLWKTKEVILDGVFGTER